jgi:Anti-sigma-K factor rskA
MMADHEHIEELIVANALGGLEPDEVRELERQRASHGPDCAECRRLEAEYDEVAGRLAFAVEPIALRPGFEDEVVATATGPRIVADRGASSDTPSVARAIDRPGRRGSIVRSLVAVAAAVALFVGGWAFGNATSDPGGIPSQARVVAFQGDGSGSLAVAYQPGQTGVYLLGSGLQPPPAGHVYEVWMIRGTTPVPGPCVRPSADGSLFAFADAALGTTDVMAVTVEPSACPNAPTTPPVFTATIRT